MSKSNLQNIYIYYYIFNIIFFDYTSTFTVLDIFNSIGMPTTTAVSVLDVSAVYAIELLFFILLFRFTNKFNWFIYFIIIYLISINFYWGQSLIEVLKGLVLILPLYNIFVSANTFNKKHLKLLVFYFACFLLFRLFTYEIETEGLDFRLRFKLVLIFLAIFYQKRILTGLLFYLSGFNAFLLPLILSFLPQKRRIINFSLIILLYIASDIYVKRDEITSRLFWNARRIELLVDNQFGYGFIGPTHPVNIDYKKNNLNEDDRFNNKIEVIDFGYIDLFLKFGFPLGLIYLAFIYKKLRTILPFTIVLSLFIINITFSLFSTVLSISQLILIFNYYDRNKQVLRSL